MPTNRHRTDVVASLSARSVVTIGNFDGVHRGHQRLISQVVEAARRRRAEAVAVTFDPHPLAVIRPTQAPQRLTSMDHRVRLLHEYGIDRVVVVPFTQELSLWSPAGFVDRVLRPPDLGTTEVHVGENFRFGSKASGDVRTLIELGQAAGFTVDTVPLAGNTAGFSSSAAREFLRQGDVRSVAAILGRPHRTSGVLRAGDRNAECTVHVDTDTALPPLGSYRCVLVSPGDVSIAANVAVRDQGHKRKPVLVVRPWGDEQPLVPGRNSKVSVDWHGRVGDRLRTASAVSA